MLPDAQRRAVDRKPKKVRVTTEATFTFGPRIEAEAWRYRYVKFDEVYVQVKATSGEWATFRLLVPR